MFDTIFTYTIVVREYTYICIRIYASWTVIIYSNDNKYTSTTYYYNSYISFQDVIVYETRIYARRYTIYVQTTCVMLFIYYYYNNYYFPLRPPSKFILILIHIYINIYLVNKHLYTLLSYSFRFEFFVLRILPSRKSELTHKNWIYLIMMLTAIWSLLWCDIL